MAVSKDKSYQVYNCKLLNTSVEREPPFKLDGRFLKHNFNTLPSTARRQILTNYKKLIWYPHMREYIRQINLIILHEKVFRNLILIKKKKKKEVENE